MNLSFVYFSARWSYVTTLHHLNTTPNNMFLVWFQSYVLVCLEDECLSSVTFIFIVQFCLIPFLIIVTSAQSVNIDFIFRLAISIRFDDVCTGIASSRLNRFLRLSQHAIWNRSQMHRANRYNYIMLYTDTLLSREPVKCD